MSLVDYIPVILFLLGGRIIGKDLKNKMSRVSYIIFATGFQLVVIAGAFKATYKLLYALGVGEFSWMSNQFFTNQALGFLLAGVGLMMYVLKPKAYSFLPTMALVGLMIIGVAAMDAALCYLANKMKKRNALVCFIVSFFLVLGMGYLSSKDFDQAFMNWAAQIVNIGGQGLFYLGVRILDKAGLKNL